MNTCTCVNYFFLVNLCNFREYKSNSYNGKTYWLMDKNCAENTKSNKNRNAYRVIN